MDFGLFCECMKVIVASFTKLSHRVEVLAFCLTFLQSVDCSAAEETINHQEHYTGAVTELAPGLFINQCTSAPRLVATKQLRSNKHEQPTGDPSGNSGANIGRNCGHCYVWIACQSDVGSQTAAGARGELDDSLCSDVSSWVVA